MKENNKIENGKLNTKEKQDNKTNLMHIKSKYVRQHLFGYLQPKRAIKCAKYNKMLTKDALESYFTRQQYRYYNDFRYAFFVEQNTKIIYQICKEIFGNSFKDLNKDLLNKLKKNIEHDNDNNDGLKGLLFMYAIPKILSGVCSLEEKDFSQLNKDDLTKVENPDADKTLQALISTILEKKSDRNGTHLHQKLVDYLNMILDCNGEEAKIEKLFDDWNTNLCHMEQNFRSAVYFDVVSKVLSKLSDEMVDEKRITVICEYLGYDGRVRARLKINFDLKYHHDCGYIVDWVRYIMLAYRKKYNDTMKYNGWLHILFDGLNDLAECTQMLEDNLKYCSFPEEMAAIYQKALMRIFDNDKERFVEYCESVEIHDDFLNIPHPYRFYGFPDYKNEYLHKGHRMSHLKFCTYKRLAGLITLWFLALILGIALSPIGFVALFWLAFAYHIFWLKIVMFWFSSIFIWIWGPAILIYALKETIKDFYIYETPSKQEYNNYLKSKYSILDPTNESKISTQNYYEFQSFRTKIINLNQLPKLYKSVNKML